MVLMAPVETSNVGTGRFWHTLNRERMCFLFSGLVLAILKKPEDFANYSEVNFTLVRTRTSRPKVEPCTCSQASQPLAATNTVAATVTAVRESK